MDVKVGSISVVHVSLSESEAQEFVIDATAVQKRVYDLLYPINAKSAKVSKPSPKSARRGAGKHGQKSGTLICPTCGRTFKLKGSFEKHITKHQAGPAAGDVAA